jgi:hypothetical protein
MKADRVDAADFERMLLGIADRLQAQGGLVNSVMAFDLGREAKVHRGAVRHSWRSSPERSLWPPAAHFMHSEASGTLVSARACGSSCAW